MKIDIEKLAENFLWDKVSEYVDQVEELKIMLDDISYIDTDIIEKVEWCEVFETEEFIVENVRENNGRIQVEFEMPFLLSCWEAKEQLLRVTACVTGICEIPDEENFDYSSVNFADVTAQKSISELFDKLGDLVTISNVKYSFVEAEQGL